MNDNEPQENILTKEERIILYKRALEKTFIGYGCMLLGGVIGPLVFGLNSDNWEENYRPLLVLSIPVVVVCGILLLNKVKGYYDLLKESENDKDDKWTSS